MAFVAIDETSSEVIGVVWLYTDSVHETGEYAILLRSDLKGRGLGWTLMQLIIEYARSEGLKQIAGQILQENSVMLKMCRELGFEVKTDAEDGGVCDVTLVLAPDPQA
jgi:acetyltransferase